VSALKEVSTGPVDRAQGDIHPGGNPHYLTDPANAKRCAKAIADKLAELDAKNAAAYRANYAAFARRLDDKIEAWTEAMAPLAGMPVVVYHRSWVYLLDWLKLRETGAIEPKPGIPPNPGHVAGLLRDMKTSGTKVILQESYYPHATAHLLAEKTGAKVVEVPGGPAAGGDYVDWMDKLLTSIKTAAGK
jgi:zinc/manganese transport system substrate-binding protein